MIDDTLAKLTDLQGRMDRMPAERAALIEQARIARHTWMQIGTALGLSHQAAKKAAHPGGGRGRLRSRTSGSSAVPARREISTPQEAESALQGTVVLDRDEVAWQSEGFMWHRAEDGGYSLEADALIEDHGPLEIVFTPR